MLTQHAHRLTDEGRAARDLRVLRAWNASEDVTMADMGRRFGMGREGVRRILDAMAAAGHTVRGRTGGGRPVLISTLTLSVRLRALLNANGVRTPTKLAQLIASGRLAQLPGFTPACIDEARDVVGWSRQLTARTTGAAQMERRP